MTGQHDASNFSCYITRYLKELKCIFRSFSVDLEVAEQSVGSIASTQSFDCESDLFSQPYFTIEISIAIFISSGLDTT